MRVHLMDFLRPFFSGGDRGPADGEVTEEPDAKRAKREEPDAGVEVAAAAAADGSVVTADGDAAGTGGGVRGDAPGIATQLAEEGGGPPGIGATAIAGATAGAAVGAGAATGANGKVDHLGQYAMREIHLRKQEDDGELVYMVIKNDGEQQNLVWLVALKNIFSKQLPNMPKVVPLDPRTYTLHHTP